MALTSQTSPSGAYFFAKRHTAMNSVTYSIVYRKDAINIRGEAPLYLQVFVNKERDFIPLSVKVDVSLWDPDRQQCKPKHKDADLTNDIIDIAVSKAKEIHRDANRAGLTLSKRIFRDKFYLLFGDNFTDFFISQVERRYSNGVISKATHKTHLSLAMKFKRFASKVTIDQISKDLIDSYEAYLMRLGNNVNSRRTALKVLHTYILMAIEHTQANISDPFDKVKIPEELQTRESLKEEELKLLLKCHDDRLIPDYLYSSVLFFLLSCFTGMRLADVKLFNRSWVKGIKLEYTPLKTARMEKKVKFELSAVAQRLAKEALVYLDTGQTMKADQTVNDHLKIVANELHINPKLHFHMGRHTFATTFIRRGGSVEVLQRILCHSKIETTMRYVGMIDDRIDREMKVFDSDYK
ncbi:MAG: site-specific integrase [Bacteroidetes bacterium]|nr:site-specific integrase [Bacteroidota bacterium]